MEQPHKHRRLSLHHNAPDPEPVLFLIGRDNTTTSSWACHSRHPDSADVENLLGKIHIGDCDAKHATTVQIEELLRAQLPPPGEEADGWPADRTSEHWIRVAVHALQDGGLVERFDLDEFMTFARSYVAERSQMTTTEEDLAPPPAIEYAHVGSEYGGRGEEKKLGRTTNTTGSTVAGMKNSKATTGRRGFWLSWPHATSNTASSSERSREASPYGGLM